MKNLACFHNFGHIACEIRSTAMTAAQDELKKLGRKRNFTSDDVSRIYELADSKATLQPAIAILKKIEGNAASHALYKLGTDFLSYEDSLKLLKDRHDKAAVDGIGRHAQDTKRGADQLLALEYLKDMKADNISEVIGQIGARYAKNIEVSERALDILSDMNTPESSQAIGSIGWEHAKVRNRALEILEIRSPEEKRDMTIKDLLHKIERTMKSPVDLLDAFTRVSKETVKDLGITKKLESVVEKTLHLPTLVESALKYPDKLRDVMSRATEKFPNVVSPKAPVAVEQAIALAKSYSELFLD